MSEVVDNYCVATKQSEWEQMKEPTKLVFKGAALTCSGPVLELLSEIGLERGALPEPLDVAAHIGNFREASITTMSAGALIGSLLLVDKPKNERIFRARFTAIAAFLASTAVQVVGESFELTTSLVEKNTGDVLDAAYGVGWSAVIATAAYSMGTKFMRRRGMLPETEDSSNEELVDTYR